MDEVPLPCAECRHATRCRRDQLACAALLLFAHGRKHYALAPRQPTSAAFEAVLQEFTGRQPRPVYARRNAAERRVSAAGKATVARRSQLPRGYR